MGEQGRAWYQAVRKALPLRCPSPDPDCSAASLPLVLCTSSCRSCKTEVQVCQRGQWDFSGDGEGLLAAGWLAVTFPGEARRMRGVLALHSVAPTVWHMPLCCLTQLQVYILALRSGLHLLSAGRTRLEETGCAGRGLDARVDAIPLSSQGIHGTEPYLIGLAFRKQSDLCCYQHFTARSIGWQAEWT